MYVELEGQEGQKLLHLSLASGQFIMSRNQLSNTNSNQENSKRIHIFIVGTFLPSENGSSSCLMSTLQLIDLEIK